MKTQILQLETHDDALSTCDKIGWSQASQVLLVWPARGQVLARRLDLALIQRHSQAFGIQLALVTGDPKVRFHARQLGISTFKNTRQAENSRWKHSPLPKSFRKSSESEARELLSTMRPGKPVHALAPAARLTFFSLGVLAVLALVATFFPSAEIHLAPAVLWQEVEFPVIASRSIQRVSLSGTVPLRALSVVVEGQDSLEPTGKQPVPDQPARGKVLFTNLTDEAILLPAGTQVSTLESKAGSRVHFATIREGRVPAGVGQTLSLPVTALKPGRAGNLLSGRIQAIYGPAGANLAVTNPEPTRGGSDRISPAPTADDRSRLYAHLFEKLQESALAEIRAGLEPGDVLLTPAPALNRTLEELYQPAETEAAYLLELILRLEFQALVVSDADLQAAAALNLDGDLPEGYAPLPQTLEVETLERTALQKDSSAQMKVRATRQIQASFSEAQAASLVFGLSPTRAAQRLASALPLAGPPEFLLQPAWWPILPIVPFRLSVTQDP